MLLPQIGQQVQVKDEHGVVRFIGKTEFAAGEWVGIELQSPVGKNDGSINGTRYFLCEKPGNYGVFVRPGLLSGRSDVKTEKSVVGLQAIVAKLQVKLRSAKDQIETYQRELSEAGHKLRLKSLQVEELETELEKLSVESDYLKSNNTALSQDLQLLQTKYSELSADYEILQEEIELNRELEEAVKLQANEFSSLTEDDFMTLVQYNKKLELASLSLKKLISDKDSKFTKEISTLNSKLASHEELQKTYDATVEKLTLAEKTINHLQELLESAAELELIIEHLTRENELLNSRNKELSETISELQEIHELDKSLEENLRKVEQDLKNQIGNLLKQISAEKSRVHKISSKNAIIQDELKMLKDLASLSSQGNSNELEALKVEVKRLKIELAHIELNFKANEKSLSSVEALNSRLVPEQFRSSIKVLMVLSKITSLIPELEAKLMADESSPQNLEIEHLLETLLQFLRALTFQVETLVEIVDLDVEALTDKLSSLQDELKNSFKTTSLSRDSLKRHIDVLRTFVSAGQVSQTLSAFKLSDLLLECHFSSRLLSTISGRFSESLPAMTDGLIPELHKLTDLAALHFSRIVESKNCGLNSFKMLSLPKINSSLFEYFQSLELDDLDTSDYSDFVTTEALNGFRLSIADCLDFLATDLTELSKLPTIYEALIEPTQSSEIQSEDTTEKDHLINDLKLNIAVLEKNLATAIEGESLKIQELQDKLLKADLEIREMERKNKSLTKTNKTLDDQMLSLIELNAQSENSQIRAFEDLKSKKGYTTEMALLDEVSMLRNMLSQSSAARSKGGKEPSSWLSAAIYPQFNYSTNEGLLSFERNAHQVRAQASQLLAHILSPTKKRLNFRQSS